MKSRFLLFLIMLSSICSAQAPWRARLFVHYSDDPTGKTVTDTVWFGCDSLGAEGFQPGLDVLDTVYEQNKTFFSDPLAQTQLGLPWQYNLKTNIKAFNKNGTVSYRLKANGWVFAISWDTTEFLYEQPDFKLFTINLFCKDCYLSTWEREQHTLMSRNADGSHKFFGRDSIEVLQGNGMELEIILNFKDTNTVGGKEINLNYTLMENPINKSVNVNFQESFTGKAIITNNLGQILHASDIQNQNSHIINVEYLTSGVYYLLISTPEIQIKPTKLLKL